MSEKAGTRQYGPLAVLVIGVLSGIMSADPIINNIALPGAAKALGISGAGVALAASIGTLAVAATVIASGAVADRVGVRRVLLIALGLGIVGNLLVAVSPGPALFLLGRAIAGVGMGALFACSFALVPHIATPERVGKVLGQWTGLMYAFTIVFTLIAGAIISLDWRLGYLVVPIACVVMLPVVPACLPDTGRVTSAKFDYVGLACLGVGLSALLVAISSVGADPASPTGYAAGLGAIVLLGAFALIEAKSDHPAFPIVLFKNPIFVGAVLAGLAFNFTEASILLQLSNAWQMVLGIGTAVVAVAEMPLTITAVVMSLVAGSLLSRGLSARHLLLVGTLISTVALLATGIASPSTPLIAFLPAMILGGMGMVLMAVPQASAYVAQAPPKFKSAVVASRTSVGQAGYAIGFALTNAIVTSQIMVNGEASTDPTVIGNAINYAMRIGAVLVLVLGVAAFVLMSRKQAATTPSPDN